MQLLTESIKHHLARTVLTPSWCQQTTKAMSNNQGCVFFCKSCVRCLGRAILLRSALSATKKLKKTKVKQHKLNLSATSNRSKQNG